MLLIALKESNDSVSEVTGTASTPAFDIAGAQVYSSQCIVDVNTPANKTCPEADVVVATSSFTVVAHGFSTGLKVGISTDDTLPAPLTATNYYVIKLSADSFQLATSLANSLTGTNVTLTDDGEGTTTFTVAALAGGSVKLEKSNDGTNWDIEGSATTITADGNVWLEKVNPASRFIRVTYTVTAGRLAASNYILAKGLD